MSELDLGLGYWLPRTQFAVAVTPRDVVRTENGSSRVARVQDVRVTPSVVQDPAGRCALTVDQKLMETIKLAIDLDDRGFIQSINTEAGQDFSPIVSLVGKAVGLGTAFYTGGLAKISGDLLRRREPSLEDGWAARHPKLVTAAAALSARSDELLARLGDPATTAAGITETGAALDVLQSQLAAISQARRAWIAGQARTLDTKTWRLAPGDLLRLDGPEVPEFLADPAVPPALSAMAGDWHVLIAIVDPQRPADTSPAGRDLRDTIALRRSRPATIAVYRPGPAGFAGDWQLDPDSVTQLDVVDELSTTDLLPLDGSWHRTNKFVLAYHPDMSLKTFGVESAPAVAGLSASLGEVVDAVAAARKDIAARPGADEERLARAKTQLELLQTANAAEILAATRARSVELEVLEQQKKLREAVA